LTDHRTARNRNAPVALDESEILGRGLDTFAELGYDATTMRELARRLGVSHNFIHDRYGSKAAFWRAVVDAAFQGVQAERDRILATHAEPAERLRLVITQLFHTAAHTPRINRVVADESARDSDRLDYLHRRFIQPFWDSITPTITELVAAGRMPDVPTHVLYHAIIGPALTFGQNAIVDRLDPAAAPVAALDRDAVADHMADVVLRGLLPDRAGWRST
jgi:TetR/AcrR family transcriptional regulator